MREIKVVDKKRRQKKKRETKQVRVLKYWHLVLKERAKEDGITISKLLEEIVSGFFRSH